MGDSSAARILRDPNNILGIEYLKALKKTGSSMVPYTILRQGAGYHDRELDMQYSSASAIRSLLAWSGSAIHTEQPSGTFDNTPFEDIARRLERKFQLTIRIGSERLKKERFSGSFDRDQGIGDILREINVDGRYTWHRKDGTITIMDKAKHSY